jgi:hypothetical protein
MDEMDLLRLAVSDADAEIKNLFSDDKAIRDDAAFAFIRMMTAAKAVVLATP